MNKYTIIEYTCICLSGLTPAARLYNGGCRHGSAVFYRPGEYPLGAVAPVQCVWQAAAGGGERRVWLSVHPAARDELLRLLRRRLPAAVTVTSLADAVVRFRLTGRASHAVLARTLVPADVAAGSDTCWCRRYYAGEAARAAHATQRAAWAAVGAAASPAELPPCCIVGLTVRDPRALAPACQASLRRGKMDTADTPDAGGEVYVMQSHGGLLDFIEVLENLCRRSTIVDKYTSG